MVITLINRFILVVIHFSTDVPFLFYHRVYSLDRNLLVQMQGFQPGTLVPWCMQINAGTGLCNDLPHWAVNLNVHYFDRSF